MFNVFGRPSKLNTKQIKVLYHIDANKNPILPYSGPAQ